MDQGFPILIAEDDDNDAMLLQRALRKIGVRNPFHISKNGTDVLEYLKGNPPYENRGTHRFPRIIFTDLKMPEMDGFALLEWLQKHPECNVIPRIVLSSSNDPSDVIKAYRLGVNAYLMKPGNFDDFTRMLRVTIDFWTMCEKPPLPPKC